MKRLLDELLTDSYSEVEKYTNYFIGRLKSNHDTSTVINNAYLVYVEHDLKDKTPTIDYEVKYYFFQLIKGQLFWNSQTKSEVLLSLDNHYLGEDNELHEDELSEKIAIETRITKQTYIIDIYLNSLNDKATKRFCETYIRLSKELKKPIPVRQLALHFGFSKSTAQSMVKRMREEIQDLQNYINTIENDTHIF